MQVKGLSRPKCLLCGGNTTFLFSARDFARPDDRTERELNWCSCCDFGRLDGNFSPSEVRTFYPDDYYTHGIASSVSEPEPTFLDSLRSLNRMGEAAHERVLALHCVDTQAGQLAKLFNATVETPRNVSKKLPMGESFSDQRDLV